ncbi:MAG: family 43 glycosylhydrolase [Tannerellaceae bacterium]|nr:family 43 glycosylhydrolase [Tannerellaceae bacterium]
MLTLVAVCCNSQKVTEKREYINPVIGVDTPDPTVIKAGDFFYLYSTENQQQEHYIPIYKSKDLVEWEYISSAFTRETRPDFEPDGGLWAPSINFINGKYVLYYAMSVWGGEWTCGIGCATATRPEGPFTDQGKLFCSNEIGVQNSIDPFYIEENGKHYLFWGSFRGIYYIELNKDGLGIKEGAEPVLVAGTAYEAVLIHKKENYYYLLASWGSCCSGDQSTYTTVVGRSESLFGSYVNKEGKSMLDNQHEILIESNNFFVGTGHNAEIMTDREGNDWILYHAYIRGETEKGRVLMLDRLKWEEGWPYVETNSPALQAPTPVF